mmetsp:Transcript_51304/g.58940  ORF Transcript_51304/g.58940 Transcript_51304/m.58940 type:complete len:417 (-) Transcript_51304:244-1494(-)|eukprot:CAMPEP_0176408818 /NCGR_PEP_ID=MMETSP0127-20121128/2165_1 /TAXON_ID=938130 /ORGANISM="Platyophrya macrostoma, Strain WH" /LENGTH=416 /DNA_ID=CAMNT_0017788151 /DNA_START=89 /DNA_END=1339 /DNA_ORIENTATION=-
MNALKLQLKLLVTKTAFERDLIRLTSTPDLALPPEKLITPILKGLKEEDTNPNSKKNIQTFLNTLSSIKRWEDAAKLLIVAHQAIYDEISAFVHEFSVIEMDNLLVLPDDKDEFTIYVRCGIIKFYYRYLKKLADSYYSVRKCRRYTAGDHSSLLKKNDTQLIFQHSQLKELVNFSAKLEDFFVSSDDIPEIPIAKLFGEMMLRDCIEFYNLVSKFITKTIDSVFSLPDELALALDAVYSDLIRLKEPVSAFYQIKRFFLGVVAFEEPIYYEFSKGFNTKEELYINSIRKQRKKSKLAQSQSMITLPEKTSDYFSIADDEHDHHHDTEYQRSVEDLKPEALRSKSAVLEKKDSLDHETLLTNEEKNYSGDLARDVSQKTHKKVDMNPSITSMLANKITTETNAVKPANFSKIQNLD